MARKRFTVLYPDHSKESIGVTERDQALLSGQIVHIADLDYRYTGQVHTLHAMSELAQLQGRYGPEPIHLRFLPGTFTIERQGRRYHERLETPEGMGERLRQSSQVPA
jgi:hypothetical protein